MSKRWSGIVIVNVPPDDLLEFDFAQVLQDCRHVRPSLLGPEFPRLPVRVTQPVAGVLTLFHDDRGRLEQGHRRRGQRRGWWGSACAQTLNDCHHRRATICMWSRMRALQSIDAIYVKQSSVIVVYFNDNKKGGERERNRSTHNFTSSTKAKICKRNAGSSSECLSRRTWCMAVPILSSPRWTPAGSALPAPCLWIGWLTRRRGSALNITMVT